MKHLALCLLVLVSPLGAATKYVSKAGSDSNDGNSMATAYLTVAKGVQAIGSGGRLYIGGGLYKEALQNIIPSGGSETTRTVITNYQDEVVTLQPLPGAARVIEFIGTDAYITVAGNAPAEMILDGANVGYNVVKFSSTGSSGGGDWPSHIRLENMELKTSPDSGVLGFCRFCAFVHLKIHGAGDTVYDHGMYIEGSDNVIDGCDIYANYARGIQIFMSGKTADSTFASRNVIRNCRVHDNGIPESKPGIDADSGTGNLIYNNLIYNNGQYGLVIQMGGTNNAAYNNTFYNNGTAAVCVKSSADVGNTARNNLGWKNGTPQFVDERGDVGEVANLWATVDPQFASTDPASADFLKLTAASTAAIDHGSSAGQVGTVVTTDYWGDTRPQGAAYDIGADEYVAAPPPPPSVSITAQPESQYVPPGQLVTFAVTVNATGACSYQWDKSGAAIPGATAASYTVANASAADMGFYAVTVTAGATAVKSEYATLTVNVGTSSRLINLSTLGFIRPGDALTPGFFLTGSGSKTVVLRAIGPTLTGYGVPNALADPMLQVLPLGQSTVLCENNDWGTTADLAGLKATADRVGAFALPDGSKDAAVVANLPAEHGYSVRTAASTADASGTAMAEIYDAETASDAARLVNVSTLGYVGASGLIPGFTIGGSSPKLLLIRAVGPTIGAQYGVPDVLGDPQLRIVPLGKPDVTIARNNDWGDDGKAATLRDAFNQTGAFALMDGSKDAAVLVRLPPGLYSAMATGVGGGTGNAIVEVYDAER